MTDETLKQASNSQRFLAQHHHQRGKRYVKAILLLLLAIAAGAVIGVGCTLMFVKGRFQKRPPRPDALGEILLSRMRESIPLNAEEEEQVKAVIDEHMKLVTKMRKQSFRDFRAVMDDMESGVAEVLGPERNRTWKTARDHHFGRRRAQPEPEHENDHH